MNGGSGGQSKDVTATYGSAMPAISATKPTRAGYTFQGWYDNADYAKGTQYYTAAGASARKWDKAADTILYAGWRANTVTLTWDYNGGKVGSATKGTTSATYSAGAKVPMTAATPVRSGYNFVGWFAAKVGDDQVSSTSSLPSANATYYAQWTPEGPKVRVYAPSSPIYVEMTGSATGTTAFERGNPWSPQTMVYQLALVDGQYVEMGALSGPAQKCTERAGVNSGRKGVTSAWLVTEEADGSFSGHELGGAWSSVAGKKGATVYLNGAGAKKVTFDANGGKVGSSASSVSSVMPYASAMGIGSPDGTHRRKGASGSAGAERRPPRSLATSSTMRIGPKRASRCATSPLTGSRCGALRPGLPGPPTRQRLLGTPTRAGPSRPPSAGTARAG